VLARKYANRKKGREERGARGREGGRGRKRGLQVGRKEERMWGTWLDSKERREGPGQGEGGLGIPGTLFLASTVCAMHTNSHI